MTPAGRGSLAQVSCINASWEGGTYLPQVIVQPDVVAVLAEAILPALRGGAAADPAAAQESHSRGGG